MDQASAFSFDLSYCGGPPIPDDLWDRWNLDPVLMAGLFGLAVAGLLMLRGAERHRRLAFAAAWIVSVLLFVSPLCALTVALFSARVVHHVALTMIVAPLLAMAVPPAWGRSPGWLMPLTLSTIALWLWHSPDLYALAFSHPAIYWAMQFSLLGSFVWLWLGLLRSASPMRSGVAALLSAMQMGLLGALLVFASQPLYVPHFATTLAFGVSPLEDQQVAGLVMWVPANLPLLALVLWRLADALGVGREAAE